MGLAYCLESEGDWSGALEKYESLSKLYPGSSLVAEAGLNAGRCRVHLTQVQLAITSFQKVIERFPRSMYAALAREELVSLLYRSQKDG